MDAVSLDWVLLYAMYVHCEYTACCSIKKQQQKWKGRSVNAASPEDNREQEARRTSPGDVTSCKRIVVSHAVGGGWARERVGQRKMYWYSSTRRTENYSICFVYLRVLFFRHFGYFITYHTPCGRPLPNTRCIPFLLGPIYLNSRPAGTGHVRYVQ